MAPRSYLVTIKPNTIWKKLTPNLLAYRLFFYYVTRSHGSIFLNQVTTSLDQGQYLIVRSKHHRGIGKTLTIVHRASSWKSRETIWNQTEYISGLESHYNVAWTLLSREIWVWWVVLVMELHTYWWVACWSTTGEITFSLF